MSQDNVGKNINFNTYKYVNGNFDFQFNIYQLMLEGQASRLSNLKREIEQMTADGVSPDEIKVKTAASLKNITETARESIDFIENKVAENTELKAGMDESDKSPQGEEFHGKWSDEMSKAIEKNKKRIEELEKNPEDVSIDKISKHIDDITKEVETTRKNLAEIKPYLSELRKLESTFKKVDDTPSNETDDIPAKEEPEKAEEKDKTEEVSKKPDDPDVDKAKLDADIADKKQEIAAQEEAKRQKAIADGKEGLVMRNGESKGSVKDARQMAEFERVANSNPYLNANAMGLMQQCFNLLASEMAKNTDSRREAKAANEVGEQQKDDRSRAYCNQVAQAALQSCIRSQTIIGALFALGIAMAAMTIGSMGRSGLSVNSKLVGKDLRNANELQKIEEPRYPRNMKYEVDVPDKINAREFLGKAAGFQDLTAEEKAFGTETFDKSFEGMFKLPRKDGKPGQLTPQDEFYNKRFDMIFIGGESVAKKYENKFGKKPEGPEAIDKMKCMVTAAAIDRTNSIEVVPPNIVRTSSPKLEDTGAKMTKEPNVGAVVRVIPAVKNAKGLDPEVMANEDSPLKIKPRDRDREYRETLADYSDPEKAKARIINLTDKAAKATTEKTGEELDKTQNQRDKVGLSVDDKKKDVVRLNLMGKEVELPVSERLPDGSVVCKLDMPQLMESLENDAINELREKLVPEIKGKDTEKKEQLESKKKSEIDDEHKQEKEQGKEQGKGQGKEPEKEMEQDSATKIPISLEQLGKQTGAIQAETTEVKTTAPVMQKDKEKEPMTATGVK